jgi:hypothetical protein
MSSVYSLKIAGISNAGLCNQLNNIVDTILQCSNNMPIIVLSQFLKNINTKNFAPISSVLNMKESNNFLKKYNIVLLDGTYIKRFHVISVKYGVSGNMIDVTENCKPFIVESGMFMANTIKLQTIFGEPCPGQQKKIEVTFTTNYIQNQYSVYFEENAGFLKKSINISFQGLYYIGTCSWTSLDKPENEPIIRDIYKNLVFCNSLVERSNKFFRNSNLNSEKDKIDVIHLRLEYDGIDFWSKQNNMNIELFKEVIVEKYIRLIRENIDKTSKIIILSYDTFNPVSKFLKENGYQFYFCVKDYNNNREESAIIDLINSKACNNVFIGVGGSTFSQTISRIIQPKKMVFFDINHISD